MAASRGHRPPPRRPARPAARPTGRPSARPSARLRSRRPTDRRGSPQLRLRAGFVIIAMVLSGFGARLVQLQGFDPDAYAAAAEAEGLVQVVLPAERGDILDRNGEPFADSVDGKMVVADPALTRQDAPAIAKLVSKQLGVDYFETLSQLRQPKSRFEYLARRVPASRADDVVEASRKAGFDGLFTRRDPVREYPAGDVGQNIVGYMGTDKPLAGFEATFDEELAGTDGSARYEVGDGNRIPLGDSSVDKARDGADLHTTLDRDLQWYTQRVLRQTVEDAGGDSGVAVVMDSRTGELLALADDPTYDARRPSESPRADRGSRAFQDVYEPGSVEKVLTMSAAIDAGLVTNRTRLDIPNSLSREDKVIHDYFDHGTDHLHLTLAGVIAKSSNIGTVLTADKFGPGQLRSYLERFGLGSPTGTGVRGETRGILPTMSQWTHQVQDRIAFGQSVSVNAVQMAAAVNTIANGGVRVSPSLVQGRATTVDGDEVGTDTATRERVVSPDAARQTMQMMERVVDPEVGVAPGAAVPGYRVAGKTGTAQRVGSKCRCYDGTFTVSFAGFAPADKPRFTIYVVVQNPRNGGGGGSVAGPAFSKLMGFALRRYAVPPTNTKASTLPTEW